MYINGEALAETLSLIYVAFLLLLGLLAAHLVWIVRLARSPALRDHVFWARCLMIVAAFLLPLVSFLVVEAMRTHRDRSTVRPWTVVALTLAALALSIGAAVQSELRYAVADRDWQRASATVPFRFLLLAVEQLMLLVFVRVFLPKRRGIFTGCAVVYLALMAYLWL